MLLYYQVYETKICCHDVSKTASAVTSVGEQKSDSLTYQENLFPLLVPVAICIFLKLVEGSTEASILKWNGLLEYFKVPSYMSALLCAVMEATL